MYILRKSAEKFTYILLFTICILIIFSRVNLYNKNYESESQKLKTESENLNIKYKVSSFIKSDDFSVSFYAKVIKSPKDFLNGKTCYINLENQDNLSFKIDTYYEFYLDEKIISPNESTIPDGFSYKDFLKSQNASFCVFSDVKNVKSLTKHEGLFTPLYNVRNRFLKDCDTKFSKSETGIIKAIISGDRASITDESYENLKASGVYHIVAISGLHLNLFIFFIFSLVAKLKIKRRYRYLLSFLLTTTVGIIILIFTGEGVSVYRALIMMIILSFSSIAKRDYTPKLSLLWSGFFIVLFMPWCIYQISFMLSFASTYGILLSIDIFKLIRKKISIKPKFLIGFYDTCIASFTVTIVTLPIVVYAFGYVSVYSFLANFLILPIMAYLLCFGVLFMLFSQIGLAFMSMVFCIISKGCIRYILWVTKFIKNIPYSYIEVTFSQMIGFIIFVASVILALFINHKKGFKKALVFILIFCVVINFVLIYNKNDDNIKIVFLDVGQADSSFLMLDDLNVLVDAGSSYNEENTSDNILKMMRNENIKNIDYLIISHYHTDHANMAPYLIKLCKVKTIVLPKYHYMDKEARKIKSEILSASLLNKVEIEYVKNGDFIKAPNGATLSFLSPDNDMFYESNDMSIVTKLTYGKNTVLFCGDIEENGISHLIKNDIESDILKVPHHGAYSNNLGELTKKVKPKISIISCGKNNVYGFPKKETLNILKDSKSKIYSTDKLSSVTIVIDKEKIKNIHSLKEVKK